MLSVFDGLRGITSISVCLRLVFAVICGGAIGIERALKRRPAGFRTHILVCLGASMTTLTSQYLFLIMHYNTDIARLGAQVIAGIGFIGAGTILVTRRQRVKGLTTAAGLWASAIVGLALGGGFYEGGIVATVLILLSELLFSKLEYRILDSTPEVNIFLEYTDSSCLEEVLQLFLKRNVKVLDLEITRESKSEENYAGAFFSLRLNKKTQLNSLLNEILAVPGALQVEEV